MTWARRGRHSGRRAEPGQGTRRIWRPARGDQHRLRCLYEDHRNQTACWVLPSNGRYMSLSDQCDLPCGLRLKNRLAKVQRLIRSPHTGLDAPHSGGHG
jgi:hypothetical protein